MKVKEQMSERVTPRQLIEKWTPGICGDGDELALVLAIESTVILIRNGAIPESRETRAFMEWHAEWSADYLSDEDDEPIH
jgi:hypothetical protein